MIILGLHHSLEFLPRFPVVFSPKGFIPAGFASWVIATECLSLGLHVDDHSRPTPVTRIFAQISCRFSPQGFIPAGFSWPPSNHKVLLAVAKLSLFFYLY